MSVASSTTSNAIVAYEPDFSGPPGPNWKWEEVSVGQPQGNEVLVELVATGVCHTDIVLTSVPPGMLGVEYPRVAGHEGAGYVKAVGDAVSTVAVGDPVLLSFAHCTACDKCKTGHPSYCADFDPLNYVGTQRSFKTRSRGDHVWGGFFGQSSFAHTTLVSEASIVNAKALVRDRDELKLFAPLGCGVQTGAGTVIKLGEADADSQVVVLGLGGVGLSAIMAARLKGCKTVVGVDRIASRVKIAKELGASHVVDTSADSVDVVKEVLDATGGVGATVCIDTTGAPALITMALQLVGKHGKVILVGVPPMDFNVEVHALPFLSAGKSLIGGIEGDVEPQKFIPQLVKWYREGKFPLDKFVSYLPADKFGEALHGMHSGDIIKPVLIW